MAKFEKKLAADFDELIDWLERWISGGSLSASIEDASDYRQGLVRLAVRVYERFSMIGGNRVSLSLTLLGEGNDLFLSAITSGGSQAVFWIVNTLGEDAFLDQLIQGVQKFETQRRP